MQNLCIIPARGGSKGIPGKNIVPVGGRPLISFAIECSLLARSVSRTVVSTDDEDIAAVSRTYGAEVVFRPREISGDTASSELALLHVLQHLESTEGYAPDLLTLVQCTSPLTLSEDIDGTVSSLLDNHGDSALTVIPFYHFLWKQDADGNAVGLNHDKRIRQPRQALEPQFLETGAVYVMRVKGFKAARLRFFGKTVLYVTGKDRCLEIDDSADLEIAEAALLLRQRKGK